MTTRKRRRIFVQTIFPKKGTKADQALRIAKKVDKKQKQLRHVDASAQGSNIVARGTVLSVTPAIKTVLTASIDGYHAQLKSIRIKGAIIANLTSTVVDSYRIDIILERDPVPGTIITPDLLYGSANPSIHAYKKFSTKERYRVLATVSGYFNSVGDVNTFRLFDIYRKLNVKWETKAINSNILANTIKNAIHIIFWTNSTQNQPTVEILTRLVWVANP